MPFLSFTPGLGATLLRGTLALRELTLLLLHRARTLGPLAFLRSPTLLRLLGAGTLIALALLTVSLLATLLGHALGPTLLALGIAALAYGLLLPAASAFAGFRA
ncbi:hypothetical protein GCM10028795_17320 [Lysobacter olei]